MSRNEDYRFGILKPGSTTVEIAYCFCQQGTHSSAKKRVAHVKGWQSAMSVCLPLWTETKERRLMTLKR